MLLVTFHGGPGGINNVQAYADSDSDAGTCVEPQVLRGDWPAAGTSEPELRGIVLYQGNLWVANGAKVSSKHPGGSTLMVFGPHGKHTYSYLRPFVDSSKTTAINHPFGFTFDGQGNCYVSNQDTNVVAWFSASGTPNDSPSALTQLSATPTYNPGTFVASTKGGLDGTPETSLVLAPQGLMFDPPTGKVDRSVRDVLFYSRWNILFVCDEVASAVKVYDVSTGKWLASIQTGTSAPTHLAIPAPSITSVPQALYISSGTQIFTYDLSSIDPPSENVHATSIDGLSFKAAAGMSFDDNGTLYVADRTARTIYECVYGKDAWRKRMMVDRLKDDPEFICYVKVS